MLSRIRVVVGIILILSLCQFEAQAQTWEGYYQSSVEYQKEGDIRNSTKALENALPLVEEELKNNQPDNFLIISNDLALNYIQLGKYSEAKALFKRNLVQNNGINASITKGNLALSHSKLANYDSAKTLLKETLRPLTSSLGPNHPETLNILNNLAIVEYNLGNYSLAERIYKNGIGQLLNAGKGTSGDFANWMNNLALLYTNLGRYEEAMNYFEKAQSIYSNLDGEFAEGAAYVKVNLGQLYSELAEYDKSRSLFQKAKRKIKKNHPYHSIILSNLAQSYYLQGKWKLADKYFTEALTLKENIYGQSHPSIALTLRGIAALKLDLGDFVTSAKLLYRAIKIQKTYLGESHPELMDTYQQLISLKLSLKDDTEAEKLLLESKKVITDTYSKNHIKYTRILELLAQLKLSKELAQAEELILESLSIKQDLNVDPIRSITGRNLLAEIHFRMKDYSGCADLLGQNIVLTQENFSPDHPSLAKLYQNLAHAHVMNQQENEAYKAFTSGLDNYSLQLKNYFPFLIESEKIRFFNSMSSFFEQFNAFANAQIGNIPDLSGEMYGYQLVTKALLLNANNKWKTRIVQSGDLKLIKQFSTWQLKSEQIHSLRSLSYSELEKRGVNIKELGEELQDLEKELLLRSNHFDRLRNKTSIQWQQIREVLEPRQAAMEIVKYRNFDFQQRKFSEDPNYAALIISSESDVPTFVKIPGGEGLETARLKQYRNAVKYKIEDLNSYESFWKPLEKPLSGFEKILISSSGVFNQINLNALLNPETKKYLIDEYDIQLLTNTRDLIGSDEEEDYNNFALLLGNPDFDLSSTKSDKDYNINSTEKVKLDPLPGTEDEVAYLEELLIENDWEVQLLSNQDATEPNLKDIYKPKLMHIATHGFFKESKFSNEKTLNNPLLNSGLMLAGANHSFGSLSVSIHGEREDGLLTAAEAVSLNIDDTDLVVLSACETGLGELRNGEGVYGLQRSLRIAGARSLIMSLWKIDDRATQELMNLFYTNWFEGQSKQEAFRNAQLTLREKYPEPYYWAAFVLLGK